MNFDELYNIAKNLSKEITLNDKSSYGKPEFDTYQIYKHKTKPFETRLLFCQVFVILLLCSIV